MKILMNVWIAILSYNHERLVQAKIGI